MTGKALQPVTEAAVVSAVGSSPAQQLAFQMGRSAALAECFVEALPPRERLGELGAQVLTLRTTTQQLERGLRSLEDAACALRAHERLETIERWVPSSKWGA
jgi:hypothetical protein